MSIPGAPWAATEGKHRRRVLILHPRELRYAGGDNVGRDGRDHERIAADVGERLERAPLDEVSDRRGRRVDHRRSTGDGDRLAYLADFERQIERQELLRADDDASALERLEAGQRRPQRVHARRDVGECVLAHRVGDRRPLDRGLFVHERDICPWHDAAGVAHGAAHAALIGLGGAVVRGQRQQQRKTHAANGPQLTRHGVVTVSETSR